MSNFKAILESLSTYKHYRGWDYHFDDNAPKTGQWKAKRAGVGMNAGSEEALKSMIDSKMSRG